PPQRHPLSPLFPYTTLFRSLFGQWHERATVVQVALGKPDADTILSIVARHGITSFCAPPTLYRLLVQTDLAAHNLSGLRHCTSRSEEHTSELQSRVDLVCRL